MPVERALIDMDGFGSSTDGRGGNFKRVKAAWESIDPEIIVKSFKKCSICNKMDGTEDHILWDNDCEMKSDVSDDDELYDDVMTDAQFPQIIEKDRDYE